MLNGVGSTNSSTHTITLPTNTPDELSQPTKVEALSPYAIYVEWDAIQSPGVNIDQYQVRWVNKSNMLWCMFQLSARYYFNNCR